MGIDKFYVYTCVYNDLYLSKVKLRAPSALSLPLLMYLLLYMYTYIIEALIHRDCLIYFLRSSIYLLSLYLSTQWSSLIIGTSINYQLFNLDV